MSYAQDLKQGGYSLIPGNHYLSVERYGECNDVISEHIINLRSAFFNLKLDPYSSGNRLRSYIQFKIINGEIYYGKFEPYLQTKSYNPDTGGIIREYPEIDQSVLQNPLFKQLLNSDISFVKEYINTEELSHYTMGVHLFRYQATRESPAYSSPVWLHKDDEDIVFVHLIDKSANAIGGTSVIAESSREITGVIELSEFLDTLVVNHDKFHAVTPLGIASSNSDKMSFRDIILVTFQRRKRK